jgi:thymidylate synthase (FAD)
MKCEAKLIAVTQPVVGTPASGPEDVIAFCARVSSGREYDRRGEDYEGLLKYCMKHKHWSIFEMANAVVEVNAPRDITRQLLRHRSFSFQEFSQRYSDNIEFTDRDYRHQDPKNRQNSLDTLNMEESWECIAHQYEVTDQAKKSYEALRDMDVAKECARVFLPEGLTMSTLYVNGTVRSWLHYLDVRDDPGVTQHEHVILAREIRKAIAPAFPKIFG